MPKESCNVELGSESSESHSCEPSAILLSFHVSSVTDGGDSDGWCGTVKGWVETVMDGWRQ